MAGLSFEDLFSGEGTGVEAVPEGVYDVKVLDARSHDGKGNGTVFLDLEVLNGPHKGTLVQGSIYIPDGSEQNVRGALFHFRKKVGGFTVPAEVGRAMDGGTPAPILAEALVGQTCQVELSVVKDGAYAGQNQLDGTKPLEGAAPVAAPVAEAAPVAAPAAAAPTTDDGEVPF
jgi:hypothetical protein